MAIEETIENKAQEALLAGGRIGLRITWKIARFLLACGWTITKGGVRLTAEQIDRHLNSGLMSEKRLQRQGEDVHTTIVPAEALKNLGASMKRAGLDYSMDINDDNTVTIMYKGRDADHMQHALDRALKETGLDTDQLATGEPDQPTPTHDAPDTQTPGRQAGGPDSPAQPQDNPNPAEHTTPEPSHDTGHTLGKTDANTARPAVDTGKPSQPRSRKDLIAAFKQEAKARLDAKHRQHQAPKRTVKQARTTTPKTGR